MPKTKLSRESKFTSIAQIPYIMVQKTPDYILYTMQNGLPDTTTRPMLLSEQGLVGKLKYYVGVLRKSGALATGGEIVVYFREYIDKVENAQVSLGDSVRELRFFQKSTCIDEYYQKLPPTYNPDHLRFWTDWDEVVIPRASREEIEGKHCVPDYGTGIKGTISDGVYFTQQMNAAQNATGKPTIGSHR